MLPVQIHNKTPETVNGNNQYSWDLLALSMLGLSNQYGYNTNNTIASTINPHLATRVRPIHEHKKGYNKKLFNVNAIPIYFFLFFVFLCHFCFVL